MDRCAPVCNGSRCGDDGLLCCTGEQLCVAGQCAAPGGRCIDAADCASGETCEPLLRRCVPLPSGEVCRITPDGRFDPVVEWEWTGGHVQSAPLVVQLTDDDANGTVDEQDIPDIVVAAYEEWTSYTLPTVGGRLVALSGDDGRVLWETGPEHGVCVHNVPAAADLDADGSIDIAVMVGQSGPCIERTILSSGTEDRENKLLAAFDAQGRFKWIAEPVAPTGFRHYLQTPTVEDAISIADLDADGTPEIVVGWGVMSATGELLFAREELLESLGNLYAIEDLDLDGKRDILLSRTAWRPDGTLLWERQGEWRSPSHSTGRSAIGRFVDASPGPQVAVVTGSEFGILDGATGVPVLGPVAHAVGGAAWTAGSMTVGDVDNDGDTEILASIGSQSRSRIVAFDPDLPPPHVLWAGEPFAAGNVGSVGVAAFDFDGDKRTEIVLQERCTVRILDGRTGDEIWRDNITNLPAFTFPVVADSDNDGNAELIVVADSHEHIDTSACTGPLTRGVRVYGDRRDRWVPTRRIWNEHAYHVDNISEDGRVPRVPQRGWETHGTWRQNRLPNPDDVTLAPDLRVVATDVEVAGCPERLRLKARIQNAGSWGVAAGIDVAFYAVDAGGGRTPLGVARTPTRMLSGGASLVELEVRDVTLDAERRFTFEAVADDDGTGTDGSAVLECNENNNAGRGIADCQVI